MVDSDCGFDDYFDSVADDIDDSSSDCILRDASTVVADNNWHQCNLGDHGTEAQVLQHLDAKIETGFSGIDWVTHGQI